MIFVVDASVAIKWFLNEPDSEPARNLLREYGTSGTHFVVPELFYYEVYSVCVRRHPNPHQFAKRGFAWLCSLPLKRFPISEELSVLGLHFVEKGLTGYDAAYAALARSLKGHWVTYDVEAFKALGKPNWIQLMQPDS